MRARRAWALALLAASAAFTLRGAEGPDSEKLGVPLSNELALSGPSVTLTQMHGFAYHAGKLFLLSGTLRTGETFRGGVTVCEWDDDESPLTPHYGEPEAREFRAGQATSFSLPARAPKSGGILALKVWKEEYAGGFRQVIFRAALAKYLQVVGSDSRVVLYNATLPVPNVPDWHTQQLTGAQMPTEDWMYENIDLVVLGPNAFENFPPEGQAALRRWFLGGGRVLIVSTDAFLGSIKAGLLPVPQDFKNIDSRAILEAMKIPPGEEERDDIGQLVYAHYHLGLGQGIFAAPSTTKAALAQHLTKAFSQPWLSGDPNERPDARIWNGQPFRFFVPGSVSPERRNSMALRAGVGVGCMLALLALGLSLRPRLFGAGIALGGVALLTVLVAREFPTPEAVVSRTVLVENSSDGRAARRIEVAYLDGLKDVSKLSVRSVSDGTVAPVHDSDKELAESALDTTAREGHVEIAYRPVEILPPPPVFRAERIEAFDPPASDAIPLNWRVGGWLTRIRSEFGRLPKGALQIERGQPLELLLTPFADGATKTAVCESTVEAVKRTFPELSEDEARAHAASLTWALERARRASKTSIVLFDFPLRSGAQNEPLCEVEGVRYERGLQFRIWVLPLDGR